MKKIIGFLAVVALLAVGGYFGWRYFESNFKEYISVAELEIDSDDEILFLENTLLRVSENRLQAYNISEDGAMEVHSEICTTLEIKFLLKNYVVALIGGENIIFNETADGFSSGVNIPGEILSAHQFGKKLYLKTTQIGSPSAEIFCYDPDDGIKNISELYNEDMAEDSSGIQLPVGKNEGMLADYCIDEVTGKEFYISYATTGEYVKLVIRVLQNGKEIKLIELDNVVYNDFDYVKDMLVFYTEHSMIFINVNTSIKREQLCYDMDQLDKFLQEDRIVYYWRDAYFDGVNNLFIINSEKDWYYRFGKKDNVTPFGQNIIYTEDGNVRLYNFSATLLEDNAIISNDKMKSVGVVNGLIAIISREDISFMKAGE